MLVKYDFKVRFNIIKYKYVKEIHFPVIFLAKKAWMRVPKLVATELGRGPANRFSSIQHTGHAHRLSTADGDRVTMGAACASVLPFPVWIPSDCTPPDDALSDEALSDEASPDDALSDWAGDSTNAQLCGFAARTPVSYTHLDVYKRQR